MLKRCLEALVTMEEEGRSPSIRAAVAAPQIAPVHAGSLRIGCLNPGADAKYF